MTRVPVDADEPMDERAGTADADGFDAADDVHVRSGGSRRRRGSEGVQVEVEREITKRALIEAISSIVVVVLYMAFTLLRDRDSGVVVLDDDDKRGPEDDWEES